MALRIVCANIDVMSEVRERLENRLAETARILRGAEQTVEVTRRDLHDAIRAAGDPALGADRMGPSAIARATGHKYTREYITELLKKAYGT